MNRVTAEQIKTAAEKHNLTLITNDMYNVEKRACCALNALYYDKVGFFATLISSFKISLNLDYYYARGFMDGWDSMAVNFSNADVLWG